MKYRFYGSLLILAAGISSCSSHIYVPNTVNVPLLKERNEFKASISPTNLQTAFALTDNIAIMANGQYVYPLVRWAEDERTSTRNNIFVDDNTRGGIIEGAVGFFKPLDPKKRMVFDVYAGGGAGSFRTFTRKSDRDGTVPLENYRLKNQFSKFFIQPSIGFAHPVVEAAFSSRFTLLNFYNPYMGPKAFENNESAKADFLKTSGNPIFTYDPAFTFRVGYKYVKFQMQLMCSVPLNNNYDFGDYQFNDYLQPFSLTMGASVNIARWYDNFRKKR
ncbi:hypothetical protein ECE50_024680 [Chitinophaga sp. Mgbs1]|uniref:Uncharacterized protein n=1 Tax=Chitinophaga solisilvae TaxID=1233460 RepID=A0A433WIJ1_9BACT|nr:hypothetical protein [Chitinophaga solisilvae]